MVFVNEATKRVQELGRSQLERFVLVLSPFAPHLAEEMWQALGHERTLAYEPWPRFDPAFTREEEVEIPVQVDGRVRARIRVPANATEEEIGRIACAEERISRLLGSRPPKRIVVVPGRLVNIVVS
jgi:leucyl-tRNA synthetase